MRHMTGTVHNAEGNTFALTNGAAVRLRVLPLALLVPGIALLCILLTGAVESTNTTSDYEAAALFSPELLASDQAGLVIRPNKGFSPNELFLRGERRAGHLLAGEPVRITLDHLDPHTSYVLDLGGDKTIDLQAGGADFMFASDGEYQAKLHMQNNQEYAVQRFTIDVSH